jgi:hypothetical protein
MGAAAVLCGCVSALMLVMSPVLCQERRFSLHVEGSHGRLLTVSTLTGRRTVTADVSKSCWADS